MTRGAPPCSGLGRGLVLGRAALSLGLGGAADPWSSREAAQAHRGRVLLSALLELRGAALKLAQFASLELDWLPEELAQEFTRACHRVPAMDATFALDALRRRIGPPEALFRHFDPVPFAAASIGQVHAATTLAGDAVAVKLQYPGMREAVRSDVQVLRRALLLVEHGAAYRRLLDEVESRLLEECDYAQEADTLAWFAGRLGVEGVAVPPVHAALSADGVLTTGRLPGVHLDEWLQGQPAQHERDAAAQRLFDVFVRSMHDLRRIHADPNPGNVLFGTGGTIGLLDFGCTRRIPDDYHAIFCRLLGAAVASDDDAAHAVYRDMGLFAGLGDEEAWRLDRAVLRPFREWVALPLRATVHDFGADPEFVVDGRRRFVAMLRAHALAGIRPEFVLVNRTLYGLYRLFERLGARVRCQAAWACVAPSAAEASGLPSIASRSSPARAASAAASAPSASGCSACSASHSS